MAETAASTELESLQRRLSVASQELRDAVNAVIGQLPVAVMKPAEFQRVLKIDRTLSSRLLRAVRMSDPLAVLHRMPGLHGTRRVLNAAAAADVDPDLIRRAHEAISNLEALVDDEVGSWQDLGVVLAGWLPEAREEFEFTNRQTAFRAMCNLRGKMCDVMTATWMFHPSADDHAHADTVGVFGLNRLKRICPVKPVTLIRDLRSSTTAFQTGLDDDEIKADAEKIPLLEEFCSKPIPEFMLRRRGEAVRLDLLSDRVGLGSLVDVYLADLNRTSEPLETESEMGPLSMTSHIANLPVRTLVFDALIHEDMFPGFDPEPMVFETTAEGIASPRDESRSLDRLPMVGSFQPLSRNLELLRIGEVGRYLDVLEHVQGRLGWERSRFRAYRWRVEYPLLGTQYTMAFPKMDTTG